MLKTLKEFEKDLYGCRFCPMCKPASEVANITQVESHTTRARAMMVWRYTAGVAELSRDEIELLYRCTLDSVSEAWCVNHYPVSAYVAAARRSIVSQDRAPEEVKAALGFSTTLEEKGEGEVLFLACEIAQTNQEAMLDVALEVLEKGGIRARALPLLDGSFAYSLGAEKEARDRTGIVAQAIRESGAHTVYCDGPRTQWALSELASMLDVEMPEDIVIKPFAEVMLKVAEPASSPGKVFSHDCRAAMGLARSLPTDAAILPDCTGPEEVLGTGDVYELPRRVLDALGMVRTFSVWSRAMAKSCGADDGLDFTYPELAAELARERIRKVKETGAEKLVTDSPLCAAHMRKALIEDTSYIAWLPELV